MRKLNFAGYVELRETAYKTMGMISNAEARFELPQLETAYKRGCEALDAIDALGIALGYIDDETNDYTQEVSK